MLSEDSSVKGSPEDNQASTLSIRGSAKISWQVTLHRSKGWPWGNCYNRKSEVRVKTSFP